MYRCAHGSDATPFHIGNTLRQLNEVWQLQSGRGRFGHLVDILQRRSAQEGQFAWSTQDMAEALSGTLDEGALEKIFGKERFLGYEKFRHALDCCESIGCVTKPTGEGFGTGSLVNGRALSAKFPDTPVFVTNAHVVHAKQEGALRPTEARVRFEVLRRKHPDAADCTVDEVLFDSPPVPIGESGERTQALDVCIVTLKGLAADAKCSKLTTAFERVSPSSHAYVIGHPDGAGLQVSLHDSQLLAISPNKRLVHYSTPTVGGSSGSPVFNTDWEVFAMHHAGSEEMPQFAGDGAKYKANEGVSFDAIVAAVNS
ncbi:MAG: trypsin-like peptidase domain-containing protein [Betaproteobacteria bacterium]|nr:trypsin-like peptidase domain-containing protein [Betaproteobacteria bacterium]